MDNYWRVDSVRGLDLDRVAALVDNLAAELGTGSRGLACQHFWDHERLGSWEEAGIASH
jgi:hypothetical protein